MGHGTRVSSCTLLQGLALIAVLVAVPCADDTATLTVFSEASGADMKVISSCSCFLDKTQALHI